MNGEPKVTIEGRVRFRDNKRWKPRYCIVTKASPVANSLQVHLHKESKSNSSSSSGSGNNNNNSSNNYNGSASIGQSLNYGTSAAAAGEGRRTLSKNGRMTVALDNFVGVQSGFPLDKENFTLAICCQDACVVLALDNRETLALWEARLRLSMPEVCHFDAQLVKVPTCGKAQLGPCRVHIQDHQFSITTLTAQGPQVVHSWKIQELRRFGRLEENLYGFEGGSRSGKGEGAHVLMLDDVSALEATFQVASQGLLNRQKKSVYNALMADLVGLRERMSSVHSGSSTTLAASIASSVYGGGSTLRRQLGVCHCHCGNGGGPVQNVTFTSRADPAGTDSGSALLSGLTSDYDASSNHITVPLDAPIATQQVTIPPPTTTQHTSTPISSCNNIAGSSSNNNCNSSSNNNNNSLNGVCPLKGVSANPGQQLQLQQHQQQHGRQSLTASQDTTDCLSTLESQASTLKLCDRSSLCSESSGTGSCSGSVGVRSDESSDYDVPKHVSAGGGAAGEPMATVVSTVPAHCAGGAVSPSSCYDQPKNLPSVAAHLARKCPCQPCVVSSGGGGTTAAAAAVATAAAAGGSAGPVSGPPSVPSSLAGGDNNADSSVLDNYDVPAQFMSLGSACGDYDTPKAIVDMFHRHPSTNANNSLLATMHAFAASGSPPFAAATGHCHVGPMMEYDTIKAISQGSAPLSGGGGGGSGGCPVLQHAAYGGHLGVQLPSHEAHGCSDLQSAGHTQTARERLYPNCTASSSSSVQPASATTDAKTRLLYSQSEQTPPPPPPVGASVSDSSSDSDEQQKQHVQEEHVDADLGIHRQLVDEICLARLSLRDSGSGTNQLQLQRTQLTNSVCGHYPSYQDQARRRGETHSTRFNIPPPVPVGHVPQLLPNRRLLADSIALTGTLPEQSSAGTVAGCGKDHAIDYMGARFMENLHLQYPLLEDTHHLQSATTGSPAGLQGGVPSAPSLV